MITPDEKGSVFHRGTKVGLIYAVISLVILGITSTQDPTGPLAWLQKLNFLLVLAPLAAASQAYTLGKRNDKP